MNPLHDTDEELDSLLRQMFNQTPAPAAPSDLARRARRLAKQHAARALARVERLRLWAFGLTAIGLVAIAAFALQIAAKSFDLSGFIFGNASYGSIASSSAAYQLFIVAVVTGLGAAIGTLLVLPALSSSQD